MMLSSIASAIILGFLASLISYKLFANSLMGFVQSVRTDVLAHHAGKNGTPTMGGIFVILPLLLLPVFTGFNYQIASVLVTGLTFAKIGALDDMLKIKRGKGQGLTAKQKLVLMLVSSMAILLILFLSDSNFDKILLPFSTQSLAIGTYLGFFFKLLVIIGAANAVNLTDGLDGLALMPSMLVFLALMIIALTMGSVDVAYAAAILVGSSLFMLWYNVFPAKVFLGDLGSLSLGALMAVLAMNLHMSLILIFVGFLFVVETLSVIIQVVSFKTRGKRVFKMSPIHHHFELLGWHESNVVTRLWLISFMITILCVIYEVGVWLQ